MKAKYWLFTQYTLFVDLALKVVYMQTASLIKSSV